ncbi:unnamed protein product [Rhizoctonia solani]|uniref:Uncharacterized protein n=1 Tax=Rhizoctonia solani TaxID=456999 RepID=A0A8H3DSD8_9AGAM|nr:unnamed protein product [Rhizoctonia solani]
MSWFLGRQRLLFYAGFLKIGSPSFLRPTTLFDLYPPSRPAVALNHSRLSSRDAAIFGQGLLGPLFIDSTSVCSAIAAQDHQAAMSAPASTAQVSTVPAAPTVPVSTARATTPAVTSVAATSNLVPTTTRTSTRRHRTTTITSASSVFPTVVPYDPAEERQADSHRTNKILIGIFTGFGVIFFGLVAFQLFRCYKRRRNRHAPLPPPREVQGGFHSRAVSLYKEHPTEFGRPPSMSMRHGSGSGLITPSVRSNAPSMDIRADENGRRSSDPSRAPGDMSRDDSPDNSLTGPALVPNDEEMGRRRSPLGSRSESPANLSPPRPPSQAQVNPRPDPRARTSRPNSAVGGQRVSSHGAPPGAMNRNSAYDPNRRSSFYSTGNRGAPHSAHARERVGLVMPQPLAPEASSYAFNSRQDGIDSAQGSTWGSRAGSEQDHNQALIPPRGPRPDSWVASAHSSTSLSDTPVSDAPSQKDGSIPRGRDRASRAEIV